MKISYDAFYLFILHLFYLPECCIFDLNISHSQPYMILYSNEYTYINLFKLLHLIHQCITIQILRIPTFRMYIKGVVFFSF